MTDWYTPINVKAWGRRLLAPRSAVLALGLAILMATEFRFDWIENAVGAYLVTTNGDRPQSGAIWDQGRQTDSARQTLAQYLTQRQSSQREAQRADSLAQVVASIQGERGAMISAEHFVALYTKLPPILSHEMVSPYTLLAHLSSGQWQRTFFERQDQQLLVYFLDGQNQVLHRISIGPGLLSHIERGEVAINSGLDHLADFADHIYPAKRFFEVLNTFPADVRQGIVAHPEDLLRVSGRIVRVGISEVTIANAVDLGFEVQDVEGPKVILMQAQQGDARRLQEALEERFLFGRPGAQEETQ